MKNLLIILLSISFFGLNAQNGAYHNAMNDAIELMNNSEKDNALVTAKNKFERIAQMKSEDWLPLYYLGLSNVYMSFGAEENKDELADHALDIVEKAVKLTKDSDDLSELYTLQGLIYVAKFLVDPMSRGQKFGQLSNQAYQKALALNPKNPRAKLMQIESEKGAAQFFKQDLQPFYQRAAQLVKTWDDFTPKSDIHPNWGKTRAQELAAKAKTTKEVAQNNEKTEIETIDDKNVIYFKINDLRNDNGHILLSLMNENETVIDKKSLEISNGAVQGQFEVDKPGKYAIRYMHDENDDQKMNTKMFGIPTEGFGTSNDARGTFGPPAFSDMIISVDGATKIVMKTKYY